MAPVNLVSFVIFELLGGAVAAGLFRLTEMETTTAKDEKVKMGVAGGGWRFWTI